MSYLLVDDDATWVFLNSRILQFAGVTSEIQSATNGQHALDLIQSSLEDAEPLPATILVDLNMPIMDGFKFIEAFKKLKYPQTKNVRIVVVSSSCDPDDIRRANMLGVKDFLQKPLTLEAVTGVLAA